MKHWSIVLVFVLVALRAHGNTITMIPLQSTNVVAGQTFSMDIVFDFSSDPDLVILGGGFDLFFEYDALEFTSIDIDYIADPDFSRPPDYREGLPGSLSWLEGWNIGSFDGIDHTGRFGTVHFTVRDTMSATSLIWASDVPTTGPPWLCFDDGELCNIFPQYNEITLTRVPIPSAALLLASALLGSGVMRKVLR